MGAPNSKLIHVFYHLTSIGLAAGCLLGSGCKSTPSREPAMEAAAKAERPVAMKGESDFFAGKLTATVTVSRGFGRNGTGGRGKAANKMERTDPMLDVSSMEDDEAIAYVRARAAMGSPLPPVTLRLKLENKTGEPLDVEIIEVNSDLGNFAVRPAKLTVAAGQTGQPDPMFSQLGVTSDEIPVKVTLRTGSGRETKIVAVKNLSVPVKK